MNTTYFSWRPTLKAAKERAKETGKISGDADLAAHVSVYLQAWGFPEVQRGAVNHWLTGTREPSVEQFMALCMVLEVLPPGGVEDSLQQISASRDFFHEKKEKLLPSYNAQVIELTLNLRLSHEMIKVISLWDALPDTDRKRILMDIEASARGGADGNDLNAKKKGGGRTEFGEHEIRVRTGKTKRKTQ